MNTLIAVAVTTASVQHWLITFLVILAAIIVIGGLIYAVETWIIGAPLPPTIRMVIGVVMIILIIIWALDGKGGIW